MAVREERETPNRKVAGPNPTHGKSFHNSRLVSPFFSSLYRAAFLAQLRFCVELYVIKMQPVNSILIEKK